MSHKSLKEELISAIDEMKRRGVSVTVDDIGKTRFNYDLELWEQVHEDVDPIGAWMLYNQPLDGVIGPNISEQMVFCHRLGLTHMEMLYLQDGMIGIRVPRGHDMFNVGAEVRHYVLNM